jgi:hypothetical protein
MSLVPWARTAPEECERERCERPRRLRRGKVNGFLADSYVVVAQTSDAHNNFANATTGKLVASVLKA